MGRGQTEVKREREREGGREIGRKTIEKFAQRFDYLHNWQPGAGRASCVARKRGSRFATRRGLPIFCNSIKINLYRKQMLPMLQRTIATTRAQEPGRVGEGVRERGELRALSEI